MDFFVTNTKGVWVIAPEHELMVHRDDDRMFIFHILNNSDYTKDLIKVALGSSGNTREVESRLADLTKLERFTFLSVSNQSRTIRDHHAGKQIGLDYYIRCSNIMLAYYTKGSIHGVSPDRSFTLKDDNTKAVLARLPVISEDVMVSLNKAGVIRDWKYVEYPWVNDFKFSQPAGSMAPEDYNKGNR